MFEQIAELHKACFPNKPWGSDEFRNLKQSGCEIVASENGFIVWRTMAGKSEIITIGVHPDARGAGIAIAMLGIMESDVKKAGAKKIFLEVPAENAPAINLGKKCGFVQEDARPEHCDGMDTILMVKDI